MSGAIATLNADSAPSCTSVQRTTRLRPSRQKAFAQIEKNLVTSGYFSARRWQRPLPASKRIVTRRWQDGAEVEGVVEILGNTRDGLPTAQDLKYHLAWASVYAHDCRRAGRFLEHHDFTSTELLHRLNLSSDSGIHYRDVERFIRVSATTSIVSTQAIFHKRTKRFVTDCFRVFDRAVMRGQQFDDEPVLQCNRVWLSSWFRENLEENYALTIDLERQLKLTRSAAQLLAAMLRCWSFAARNDRCFQKLYADLCALLGIPCYAHLSKAVEKLGPSLEELRQFGYIVDWQIEHTRDGDDLKVVLWTQPHLVSAPKVPAASPRRLGPHPDPVEPGDDILARELVRRGVSAAGARRLLKEASSTALVERQLSYYDRVLASSRGRALRNPAGFLVTLIRDGVVPDSHEPERARSTEPNYFTLLHEYRRYVAEAVQAHLAQFSDAELAAMIDRHVEEFVALNRLARTWTPQQQRGAGRLALEAQVAKALPLRHFRDFLADQACPSTGEDR